MLKRLNHVAIAVPDLAVAMDLYKGVFGATISKPDPLTEHGVTVAFIDVGNTKIELLEPLGENSPINAFLQKSPAGGVHHLCYEVDDILKAAQQLKDGGARILGDGKPKIGAHGKPVLFLHPKDFNGTLIELEEV